MFEACERCQYITIQAQGNVKSQAGVNDAVFDTVDRYSGIQLPCRCEYLQCGSVMLEPVGGPGALDQCVALGGLDPKTRADPNTFDWQLHRV